VKGDKVFRLGPDAIKEVQAFQQVHSIKTFREALEKLITESYHTRLYLNYFLSHRDATKEDPECLRRIEFMGSFFCCKHAPRITELPTLEICKACKSLVIAWVKRAEDPSISSGTSLISQDVTGKAVVTQVWCGREGGLYVFKPKCMSCKEPCEKKQLFT
jgi:hypothetical protein